MEELEKKVKEQNVEIERLSRELENFGRVFTLIKCRDCLFRTNDVLKMQEHAEATRHLDYCFIRGNAVVTDWIHFEVKRKKPELNI